MRQEKEMNNKKKDNSDENKALLLLLQQVENNFRTTVTFTRNFLLSYILNVVGYVLSQNGAQSGFIILSQCLH